MIRVTPWDEPNSCGTEKRSRPSTRRPRWASSNRAALPIPPTPTTIASKRSRRTQRAYRRRATANVATVDVSLDLGIVAREPALDVIELCVEAEERGFGGLWVADSQAIFRDAFAILAVAAARTQRILLSTGVTNPVTRHPAVLAGSFATLDELAPGRVVLTLGRGESAVFTIGRRPATTSRLEQSVHALRALLAGETVSWDGGEARLTWPTRPVPIYLAASGPRTLRLAGRIAGSALSSAGRARRRSHRRAGRRQRRAAPCPHARRARPASVPRLRRLLRGDV